MDAATEPFDSLIRSAARRLKGHQRRLFLAEVVTQLCDGNPRQAERRFGWGRDTVHKGLHEARQGIRCQCLFGKISAGFPLVLEFWVVFIGS